ncbi:MAG: hypothetical protein ACI9CF_001256 [Candidatus Omnitrophota bacterium]|jgi:hypothetical protein
MDILLRGFWEIPVCRQAGAQLLLRELQDDTIFFTLINLAKIDAIYGLTIFISINTDDIGIMPG